MTIAYQYEATGYFTGAVEDHGLLPNNATYTAPKQKDGYIPCWNGKKWDSVENHKGEEGFVNGEAYTVKDYGPYPEGWSKTPPPPAPPTQEERIQSYTDAIQTRLDTFVKTRNYDNLVSACTYATSNVGKFRIEGQFCVDLRDQTWAACYAIMDKALAGTIAIPTLAELLAMLPELCWPEESA